MNRKLMGLVATAIAFCSMQSCSEGSPGKDITGIALNDSTADESRVASATVTLARSTLQVGDTTRATAILRDWQGRRLNRIVVWSSSNASVATVSDAGLVTAISAGTATITATRGTKRGSAILTVTPSTVPQPPAPVASVSVSPEASTLEIGGTVQLSVTARDANDSVLIGRVFTSSSADAAIASVNALGLVTAVSAGTTGITVTSEGKSAVATITVTAAPPPPPPPPIPVASVAVSPATASLQVGATAQLSAVTRDASGNVLTGRTIVWSSSSASVASVTSTGRVTGVGVGSATITATSEGRAGSATVAVTLAPVASVTVAPTTASVSVGQTRSFSATLRDGAGITLSGRSITWSSSNLGVATVSASGLASAIAAGTATITATSEGISGTATMTVPTPPPPPPPPPTGSAPEPGAGDVMLIQDDFNRATVALQLAPYARAGDFSRVTDGHGGEALRVSYQPTSWDTNTIDRALSSVATDVYFRYWYRLSPGADVSCGNRNGSGFKWFMTHRSGGAPRYTHGVSLLDGGPAGFENIGMEFTTHDNSSVNQPNPFSQNVNKSKRFNTTNDGQWHKYTLHIVTGNGGYEQIWIDDVLVLNSQAYGYDHSPVGIERIAFPGTMVSWFAGCEWSIDIDDLAVWRR